MSIHFTNSSFLVKNPRSAIDIRNRPRIPIPDEDPYSVAGSGSSGNGNRDRSRDKPPKLPPRDSNIYSTNRVPKVNRENIKTTKLHLWFQYDDDLSREVNSLKQEGSTYGPQDTSGPPKSIFSFILAFLTEIWPARYF